MRLDIRGQDIELTDALRAHAQRRLRFSLGRFGQRIARVTVHLMDLKDPRGEADKQCQMVADLTPSGRLTAQVTDADLYAAIDRAADRLSRVVSLRLEGRREA